MTAFYVCGGLFAAWALVVSFLGITRENFPGSDATARLVGAVSLILAALAIGTAVYGGASESEEEHEEEAAGALVLPL